MFLNNPVSEIMTTNVLFVHFNNKLHEVERLMKAKRIKHVPVIKEGKLSGIVSFNDLQRLGFTKSVADVEDKSFIYDTLSIEDIMMSNPVTITSQTSIRDTIEVLIKNDFHALPVVDNELLQGIVTTTDLMAGFLAEEKELQH